MLCLGTLQFDKIIRREYPTFHRWCGRGYVTCGVLSLFALQGLRTNMGAGSSTSSRSDLLVLFVDITSTLWCAFTGVSVFAAVNKWFSLHRDCMAGSLALAIVPIIQRGISWCCLAPASMVLRCIFCVVQAARSSSVEEPVPFPWLARWGPPTSRYSLLFGSCDTDDKSLLKLQSEDNRRACPYVLSLDGYGEGEHLSFPLSALLGLIAVLIMMVPRGIAYATSTLDQPMHVADGEGISSMTQADVWRSISEAMMVALHRINECWGLHGKAMYKYYTGGNLMTKLCCVIILVPGGIVGTSGIGIVGVICLASMYAMIAILTLGIAGILISFFLVVAYVLYSLYISYLTL